MFGVELPLGGDVTFSDAKKAIFTWYGCKLKAMYLSTASSSFEAYKSDASVMISYVNTHAQLEFMRDLAFREDSFGPRVCVYVPSFFFLPPF